MERSLPFQSNNQQPTQSLRQAGGRSDSTLSGTFSNDLRPPPPPPPQPSTAVHAYGVHVCNVCVCVWVGGCVWVCVDVCNVCVWCVIGLWQICGISIYEASWMCIDNAW